jgi:hypothetical protein
MMFGDFENVGHFKTPKGAQIIGLPFEDPNYEMVFVLPPENTSKA